jgi:hypothetical protein
MLICNQDTNPLAKQTNGFVLSIQITIEEKK